MPLPPLVRILAPSVPQGPAPARPDGGLDGVVVFADLFSMQVELQGGLVVTAGALATSVPLKVGDGVMVLPMGEGSYEVIGRAP